MIKKVLFIIMLAVTFTACIDQDTLVIVDKDTCITCDENGCDTTLIPCCFESPRIISQGIMLKSIGCIVNPVNPIKSLYVYDYIGEQFVIKEDLSEGSTNRDEFTNPYTQCGINNFCIDWLKIGYNSFFLVTTDKYVENGFGDGKVNNVTGDHKPIFPSSITSIGSTSGTVILNTSSEMDASDVYMIHSTLKFNLLDLIEDNVRYTFKCSDNVGNPDPLLMSDGYGFEDFNGDNGNFDRPDWELQDTSKLEFTITIGEFQGNGNGNGNGQCNGYGYGHGHNNNNHEVINPINGFITIWDNYYETGTDFSLKYTKETKHNGTWSAQPEQVLSAADMARWIYGGVERKITFLKGTPPNDDNGIGCITVDAIGQESISQEVTIN